MPRKIHTRNGRVKRQRGSGILSLHGSQGYGAIHRESSSEDRSFREESPHKSNSQHYAPISPHSVDTNLQRLRHSLGKLNLNSKVKKKYIVF